MKLYLTTNTDLNLTELAEFNIVPTLLKVNDKIRTKYNPYHASTWGDFDFVRTFAPKTGYDARGFLTTAAELKSVGITGHLGMYDMVDNDGILDFYAGVPTTLDKRAKKNGFKTNEAWLIVHELCHGLCQKQGKRDDTHVMDDQGRLKELWNDLYNQELKTKVSLLQEILKLATVLFSLKKKSTRPTELTPLVSRKAEAIISAMAKIGHAVRLVEGYRSFERQTELYNQGRTTSGAIVTNARAGESFHNYGVAVDFVFRKEGYNAPIELWELLGSVGKSQGFEWGGDWKGFTDRPHFELTLGYSLKDFQGDKVNYSKFN